MGDDEAPRKRKKSKFSDAPAAHEEFVPSASVAAALTGSDLAPQSSADAVPAMHACPIGQSSQAVWPAELWNSPASHCTH